MIGRKKLGLCLSLVFGILLMVANGAWAAGNTPSDVPTSHWAYQAVKQLLDKGYLELYQDQTFRGEQPVDRYTLATIVAKILKETGSGAVPTNREDVKLLRSLTNEFREELVKVLTNNSSLSKKFEELLRQDQVSQEDLTRTNAAVQNISTEQAELQKEVQQSIADIIILKKKVDQLQTEIDSLKEQNKKQNQYIFWAFVIGIAGAAL